MRIYLPYRGEFGHKIMWHVPTVHADKAEKVVCCEEGEEALFPSAARHIPVSRNVDKDRHEHVHYDGAFIEQTCERLSREHPGAKLIPPHRGERAYFIPRPRVQMNAGVTTEIVVCPRRRKTGTLKNWQHWPELVKALGPDRCFAAGAPDSSADVLCERAWDYPRYLDATIEAMLSCRVVVATNSGLAMLALLCGKPLYIIAAAAGHSGPGYPPINTARHDQLNHYAVEYRVISNAWDSIAPVLEALP